MDSIHVIRKENIDWSKDYAEYAVEQLQRMWVDLGNSSHPQI